MIYVLYVLHIFVSFFLILVVLLQQGKGADLSVFGGGSTQTAFGARGATQLIHKLTIFSFVLFMLTTLGIGVAQNQGGSTVMDAVAAEEAGGDAVEAGEDNAPETAPAADPLADGQSAPVDPLAGEADDEGAASDGQTEGEESPNEDGADAS